VTNWQILTLHHSRTALVSCVNVYVTFVVMSTCMYSLTLFDARIVSIFYEKIILF